MLSEKEEPGHGGFDEEKWTIADGLRPALEKAKFDLIHILGRLVFTALERSDYCAVLDKEQARSSSSGRLIECRELIFSGRVRAKQEWQEERTSTPQLQHAFARGGFVAAKKQGVD